MSEAIRDLPGILQALRHIAAGKSGENIPNAAQGVNFGDLFKKVVDGVAKEDNTSTAMSRAYQTGEEKDLSKVMIQLQKSSIAFKSLTQVRNRLVDAYQEIMRMPI